MLMPLETGAILTAVFRARPDKEWSLIDRIPFVVMAGKGLSETLTGDRHFEQAGFKPLLK
jgi:predicted nucleic acid-binding protein